MALDAEGQQELVDKIMAIFTNEAEAASFGEDPQGYIDENLPEGTEPGDVASCMPAVGESLGGSYGSNLAGYNSAGAAATHSVASEIAYTYNTTYQQNTFIYAEEGSQVTNIQGDGNAVAQQDIDAEFNIGDDYGSGEEDTEPTNGTEPEGDGPPNDGISTEDLMETEVEEPEYEEPENPIDIDIDATNTANAGVEPEVEEAPEPEPEPDLPDA